MATFSTLSDYLTQLRRLLHDSGDVFWSAAAKTAYINAGMQQRDRDTGMNRTRALVTLTAGTSQYLLTAANSNTYDVVTITLFNGTTPYQLEMRGFGDNSIRYRGFANFLQQPICVTKYGASSLIFLPPPDQNYVTEWDCVLISPALVNTTDRDPLPYPWTDPVPYMAAHFANLEIQKQEEADRFLRIYTERLAGVQAGARGMMIRNPYFSAENDWPT